MLAFTSHRRRQTARGLITLLLGLWALMAIAPCTMAANPCHNMSAPCAHTGDAPVPPADDSSCTALQAADCQIRDAGWLAGSIASPDLALPAPQAFLQPQAVFLPFHNMLPNAERYVLRLSSPPLYLQHNVFLI